MKSPANSRELFLKSADLVVKPRVRLLATRRKKTEAGSLEYLKLKTFQRLKRSLDKVQSKVTAEVQTESILSGSKSELMKSLNLANFNSLFNV